MNTRVNREAAGGRALKPYVAIAALVVVAAVVGFSLAERWLVGTPPEDETLTETGTGGGRVVIGRPDRGPVPPVAPQEQSPAPDASYKPEEFTFYKSLGGTGATEPTLTPSRPSVPPPPVKPDAERAARPGPSKTYTVQVGSFQDRRAADRLAARVRRYRHVVSVHRVVLPDSGVRYRVRMGAFRTRQDALKLAATLKQTEKLDPFVAAIGAGATGL